MNKNARTIFVDDKTYIGINNNGKVVEVYSAGKSIRTETTRESIFSIKDDEEDTINYFMALEKKTTIRTNEKQTKFLRTLVGKVRDENALSHEMKAVPEQIIPDLENILAKQGFIGSYVPFVEDPRYR